MLAQDFTCAVAQSTLGSTVPADHQAFGVEHEDRVVLYSFNEEAKTLLALAESLPGPEPLDELSNLAPDSHCQVQNVVVEWSHLMTQELQYTQILIGEDDRKCERRMETCILRGAGAGKMAFREDVGYPDGLAGARSPSLHRGRPLVATHRHELVVLGVGLAPGKSVAQDGSASFREPNLPNLPTKSRAHLLEDLRQGAVEAGRCREDAGSLILNRQPRVRQLPLLDVADDAGEKAPALVHELPEGHLQEKFIPILVEAR